MIRTTRSELERQCREEGVKLQTGGFRWILPFKTLDHMRNSKLGNGPSIMRVDGLEVSLRARLEGEP